MIDNLLCRLVCRTDGFALGFSHPVGIGGGVRKGHSKGMVTEFSPLSAICLAAQAEFKEAV